MTIRSAFSAWPLYNQRLREVVAQLTDEQLAIQPSPERWPLWATIGHLACQRVSGICGLLGESGAETTPFPDALYSCPGDEYLEPALNASQLVEALDSTFVIIEACLDHWTPDMLDEVITRRFDTEVSSKRRGTVLERSLAHDVYHIAEINETLSHAGLRQIDLWS